MQSAASGEGGRRTRRARRHRVSPARRETRDAVRRVRRDERGASRERRPRVRRLRRSRVRRPVLVWRSDRAERGEAHAGGRRRPVLVWCSGRAERGEAHAGGRRRPGRRARVHARPRGRGGERHGDGVVVGFSDLLVFAGGLVGAWFVSHLHVHGGRLARPARPRVGSGSAVRAAVYRRE